MKLSLVIWIFLLKVHFSTGCTDTYRDIGFIFDTSTSMCPPVCRDKGICNSYEKGKDFINILARIANFTTNGSHGAFMFFSDPKHMEAKKRLLGLDSSRNLIEFSDQFDTDTYTKLVNNTIQDIIENKLACEYGGNTKILNALDDSLSKMFQSSKGMREYAEKVAVLITDGRETGSATPPTLQDYKDMAKNFKQRKIKVLAIGVGDVDDSCLQALVQSPEHFISVDTFDILVDNLTDLIGAIICKDPQLGPCPAGYTQVDGHVDQVPSEIKHANATFEECKESCENDTKCVSFEYCHYWCDPKYGFPYINQCIINYKSFPQGDAPVNFFKCSKDCPNYFAKAEVLYCDKDCGADWIDNKHGCQIDDADAFCRLKHCNENAAAKSFDVVQATHQPGFACRGIGSRFGRKRNGIEYGYYGFLDFHYHEDIKNSHGEGKVITNVICENKTNDCIWSEWLDTDCSVTCGEGNKTLRRFLRKPAEIENGGTCDGLNVKIEPCDTRVPCKYYGCVNGDVKLTRGNLAQIYWNRKWMNICPFQFTGNKYGIEKFCAKFGLYLGGTTRRATELEEKYHTPIKYYESFLVGTCKPDDKWPYCTVDCNIEGLGGGCSTVDFPLENEEKKYYVCRKEQSWLYFLHCNGSKDLPLSSCCDIKLDSSGPKTETSGGNLTITTDSFTFDDQVSHSKPFEIHTGKPIAAGSSTCILNLLTFVMMILIL